MTGYLIRVIEIERKQEVNCAAGFDASEPHLGKVSRGAVGMGRAGQGREGPSSSSAGHVHVACWRVACRSPCRMPCHSYVIY